MPKKLQTNLKGFTKNVQTRSEILNGVEYIVAPVTMIVEGVLPGSGGPIMYTANEIAASVSYWDGIPVTVNHPTDSSGNNVSARIPSVIEEFGVGQIFNTQFDAEKNSLKAEAWLNKAVLEDKFPNVYSAILDDNTNMEVSTGVFFDDRGEPGDFDGISYNSTAYAYHGDHLALLPNATGACSWTDGCGLRANSSKKKKNPVFNEISFSDISSSLWRYVDPMDDNSYIYYIDAIYESYFTFEKVERNGERQRTLWKQGYSKPNDIVTPIGTPQRVIETRVYTVVSEDAQQSSGTPTITNTNKESDMADTPCCPEKVESLIAANTNAFTEDDKEVLLTMNEKQLESTLAMSEKLVANEVAKTTTNTDTGGNDLETTEEFVGKAPEHIKIKLNVLLEKEESEKQAIIENILKDENCTFEKDELNSFEVNMLQKIAGIAKKEAVETNTETEGVADMSGSAGVQTNANIPGNTDELSAEDTLQIPVANWTE